METIARRAGWRISGKQVDASMVTEAVVGIMIHEPWREECMHLMRGGPGARERAPFFLAEILYEMIPTWRDPRMDEPTEEQP